MSGAASFPRPASPFPHRPRRLLLFALPPLCILVPAAQHGRPALSGQASTPARRSTSYLQGTEAATATTSTLPSPLQPPLSLSPSFPVANLGLRPTSDLING